VYIGLEAEVVILLIIVGGFILLAVFLGERIKDLSTRIDTLTTTLVKRPAQEDDAPHAPLEKTAELLEKNNPDWRMWDTTIGQWENEGGHVE